MPGHNANIIHLTPSHHKKKKDEYSTIRYFVLAGVSNLLVSLGHVGRRGAVLDHILNTQTVTKTDKQKKVFKYVYDFVLDRFHRLPGLHAAHRLRAGSPCLHFVRSV